MAKLDDLIRETQALAKQQDAAFTAAAAPVAGGARSLSMSYPIGSRVLDLVTGVQGVVVNGKRENVIISPA